MRHRIAFVLLALAAAACGAFAHAANAAAPAQPRLQLRSASTDVTLFQYGGKHVYLDLGVYVQSLGANFQLNVTRRYGHPIEVAQVKGATESALPGWVAGGWNGMNNFLRYSVRDASGRVVWRRAETFCPDDYGMQRVNPSGPLTPSFPQYCSANPFTLGMVWGIDKGWATPLADAAPSPKIDTGRYTITVRIAKRYADLFGIPAGDAVRTVSAVVKKGSDGGCPPFCGDARQATSRSQ
ncbi:MAG: hypothetical protein ACREMU_13890, partial [Gemmatimonadaceae bacterium]